MKKYLTVMLLFVTFFCSAQHLEYTNDAAGNRKTRRFLWPRLANPSLADSTVILKYGISVYPNPVPDKINIGITSLEEGRAAKVYLSDEQGKILILKEQNSKLEAMDLSNLTAGIYFIMVYIGSERVSYKVIKL